MPSFTLTSLSTTARVLDDEDVGFIGQNGALVTTGAAVTASDANGDYAISVLGAINANDGSAIDVNGQSLDLFIGSNASVVNTGTFSDTITGDITAGYDIVNNGDISSFGNGFAIRLFAGDSGHDGTVINNGNIGGTGGVVFRDGDFGQHRLVNTGTIIGTDQWATYVDGNNDDSTVSLFLDNSGVIHGRTYAVETFYATLTVVNSGTMMGRIHSVGDQDDRIVNTGLIEGSIALSSGDDFLDSRGGEIVTTGSSSIANIQMEAGDDTAYGSSLSDTLDGGAGEDRLRGFTGDDEINGGDDNDDVRGGAGDDFVLGDGGDDMVHGGQGDDRVRGNAGNDEVRGGSGDDVVTGGSGDDIVAGGRGDDDLYGNSGADVFEFNLSAGFDIIHDYRDGLDMIDLEAFGTRFNRVADAMETVNGNAIIDLSMLGGEGTIVVRGAGGDLDASDFIF